MGVLWGILIYSLGLFTGFLIHVRLMRRRSFSGTIHVIRDEEKTLYSLELEEYPEEITLKKEVVFKVDASEVELGRN